MNEAADRRDDDGEFCVVVNEEHQHAVWPAPVTVPDGWRVVHGPMGHAECVAAVDREWTDMRPRSLADRHRAAPLR